MNEAGERMAIVVSAPSGAGKTTLCRKLLQAMPELTLSVSHTTRALRGAERDAVDYHFESEEGFAKRRSRNDFLEWAHVHGHSYGSSREQLKKAWSSGSDVLCDIDIQGGYQLRQALGRAAVLIFIVPPSMQELERRLRGRQSDSEDVIAQRLITARQEIEGAAQYDYWLENADLEEALANFQMVVRVERMRRMVPSRMRQHLLEQA